MARIAALAALFSLTAACGRGGFPAIHDELAECWPECAGFGGDGTDERPFPFTLDDPNFFSQVASLSAPLTLGCEALADLSITDGAPQVSIVNDCAGGSSTLTHVSVGGSNVSDGYRCRGSGTTMNIVESWVEGSYYGIQCYDPDNTPASVLDIRGTTISGGQTAQAGIFIADFFSVDVHLTNVLFRGGTYGLRFHADGASGALYLNNVCFYGESDTSNSFGSIPFLVDPDRPTIAEWNNVRWCTIENDVLRVHGVIPPPQ